MKKYEIWQVAKDKTREFGFMSLSCILELDGKVNRNNYEKVYEGEFESGDLEELFTMFNLNHPVDFRGHSMSTSDVVVLEGQPYYCDSFGWEKIDW